MKRSLPSQLDIKVRFGILNISLLMGLGPVLNGAYNASKARVRLFTKAGIYWRHATDQHQPGAPEFRRNAIFRAFPDELEGFMITSTPMGRVAEAEESRRHRIPRVPGRKLCFRPYLALSAMELLHVSTIERVPG